MSDFLKKDTTLFFIHVNFNYVSSAKTTYVIFFLLKVIKKISRTLNITKNVSTKKKKLGVFSSLVQFFYEYVKKGTPQTEPFATTDSTPQGDEIKWKNTITRPLYTAIR